MKRGIVSLILVLMVATGAWALADDSPVTVQQDDNSWVFMGPQHGSYLGVRTEDVTKERLGELKLKEEIGAEVMAVDQDAPAGKAGIKEHDVIVSVNGQKVESEEQLRRMVRELPPGRQIAIGLMRAGQPLTVQVTLADRKKAMQAREEWKMEAPMAPMPPMPPMDMDIPNVMVTVQNTSRTGLLVENLTPQLAEFFGAKNGRGGVLVRSVEKGSVAETAGFKAGDVIISVDKEAISDPSDWRRATRSHSGATPIGVLRDKKEQTLTMKLPERRRSEMRGFDGMNIDVDLDMDAMNELMENQKMVMAKFNEKNMKNIQKQIEKAKKDLEKQSKEWKFEYDEE